jgi:hypothetical protein
MESGGIKCFIPFFLSLSVLKDMPELKRRAMPNTRPRPRNSEQMQGGTDSPWSLSVYLQVTYATTYTYYNSTAMGGALLLDGIGLAVVTGCVFSGNSMDNDDALSFGGGLMARALQVHQSKVLKAEVGSCILDVMRATEASSVGL